MPDRNPTTYFSTTSIVLSFWQCAQFRHLHNWLPFGKIMLGRRSRPLMTYQCFLKVLKYKILFVRLPAQRRHSQERKFVLLCLIFDISWRIWRLSINIIVLFVYPQCTGILFILPCAHKFIDLGNFTPDTKNMLMLSMHTHSNYIIITEPAC